MGSGIASLLFWCLMCLIVSQVERSEEGISYLGEVGGWSLPPESFVNPPVLHLHLPNVTHPSVLGRFGNADGIEHEFEVRDVVSYALEEGCHSVVLEEGSVRCSFVLPYKVLKGGCRLHEIKGQLLSLGSEYPLSHRTTEVSLELR